MLFSTLVTLLLVPSAYLALDDLRGLAARGRRPVPAAADEPLLAPEAVSERAPARH